MFDWFCGLGFLVLQAIGYDFDYDDYHRYVASQTFMSATPYDLLAFGDCDWLFTFVCNSFVHGRLPYENLKPDPVLRSLLLSLPLRKIVSIYFLFNNLVTSYLLYSLVCILMVCASCVGKINTDLHKCGQSSCC